MEQFEKLLKDKKSCYIYTAIIIAVILVGAGIYYATIGNSFAQESTKLLRYYSNEAHMTSLKDNERLRQGFQIAQSFDGISVRLGSYSSELAGKLHVALQDAQGKDIYEWEDEVSKYCETQFYPFQLEQTVEVTEEELFWIVLWVTETGNPENGLTTFNMPYDQYGDVECQLAGEPQDYDIEMNVFATNGESTYGFTNLMYWMSVIVFCIAIVAVMLLATHTKAKLEHIFLVVMSCAGIFYLLFLPPFSAPDEPVHFATAYEMSNTIMGQTSLDENGKVMMRQEDLIQAYGTLPTMETYQWTFDNLFALEKDGQMVSSGMYYLGNKCVITHLPGAVGITIARVLHLGGVATNLLGRFCTLLFFILVTYFAIKITPMGKLLIATVALCPMMAELASSYSYDAVVNSLSFLSFAYILHCIYNIKKMGWKQCVILAVLALLLAPTKIVYSFLFVMCIFIGKDKFQKNWQYWVMLGVVVACIVFSNAYVHLATLSRMTGNAEQSKVLEQALEDGEVQSTQYYNLTWCIQHPVNVIKIYALTSIYNMKAYVVGAIGYMLGWIDIRISISTTLMIGLVMLMSIFVNEKKWLEDNKISVKMRVCSSIILALVYTATLASMLLGWTKFGNSTIEGVQGRYFIAIIPLCGFLITNKKLILPRAIELYAITMVFAWNITALLSAMHTICVR